MTFAGMTALCSVILLLLLCASSPCHGDGAPTHNITAILAASSDFSDFSAALAAANLTGKIDRHATITVLAVDDAGMSRLRARRLTPESLGRVLSLHVLLDYFGDAKLKALNGTTQAASLFQDSGAAPGGAGMVGIASVAGAGGGQQGVAFSAADAGGHTVFYEKSVKEAPYDIAVLQLSDAMESPSAEGKPLPASPAPVAAPAPSPATAPSSKNQTAPPPQPAAAPSQKNQTAPAPPPKPAVAPSSPRNHTAPPPKPAGAPPAPAPAAPADAPDADDPPPADETGQHNDGADGTVAPWSVFAAVAAVVLLLW